MNSTSGDELTNATNLVLNELMRRGEERPTFVAARMFAAMCDDDELRDLWEFVQQLSVA